MTLEQLHADYTTQRMAKLSVAEFASLLTYAPVLMVAVSDHNVDHLEMGYLTGLLAEQTLVLHAPDAAGPERQQMLQTFMDELKYLLYHLEPWEEKILSVLKAQLDASPDNKAKLQRQMLAMAMASRGINEMEQQKIAHISARLGLQL